MAVKIKIYTLGCKVNQYDSGKLASKLAQAGFMLVDKNVDIAIINSCAVTKTAMVKSGRMIKLAKKENPKAKIVLAGCWPRAEEIKKKMASVDLILEETDIIKFLAKFKIKKNKKNILADQAEHSRYFIKIQDGCEQYCTYCIIPYTRGKLKSRAESEVIEEIKQAVVAGYSEIVLSGIHLGLYGKDNNLSLRGAPATRQSLVNVRVREIAALPSVARNDSLVDLLKRLISIDGLGRIRLSSIEITEVSDELIALMVQSDKICKHLHIPLQAGSDKILKLMNRPYDIKYFSDRIKTIRRAVPEMAISTDVIVGFPGETEKDFSDTVKFIKQIKFSRLHAFPYSAHAKTPASKFSGQVDEKIKTRRAKILRRLGFKLIEDYKKKFKGRELEVVVEQIKQGKIIGKTEYYFEAEAFKNKIIQQNIKIGEIVKIKY
ncbi:MAG: MiaB/RimO family radical SAM methylthiotransferase [bacterium]|nr:MiaB/RimO family radical SAM methylthiotransferase [bacterium]